ncbi:hypothetical protein EJB05_32500, partial [Eragrostis curvula]
MPLSNLCLLLATVAAHLLAPIGRVHAGIQFPTPASANLTTRWTVSLNTDEQRMQSFTFQDEDRTTVIVFLLQSIKDHPQDLSFAACFYCTDQCTDFLFGICIVFVDDGGYLGTLSGPIPQVVWSANRGHLVRENATLSFTASGDLQLWDIDGGLVWSTGTSELSVARMTVTKSGNLVLFNHNNMPVWQSFDNPTDSLLPGQPLVEGMRLRPNVSATNWTISNQLYITIRADGLYAFAESSPPQLYYQKTVTQAGNRKTYMTVTNGSLVIFASSTSTVAETNMMSDQIGMTYIRLESDGHLKKYQYVRWVKGWQMVQDILVGQVNDCAYPTVCGEYGICNSGNCSCPMNRSATYFKQIDDRMIHLGCTPVIRISCVAMADHQLLALSNTSYFNYIDTKTALPQLIDEESCKKACLSNCSCKAALFQYSSDDTSKGSCYLPTQLFSLQVNQKEVSHYSSSAYLKIDYNKRPQMSVVVKVLEGVVNVEPNIEFNFVATVPSNLGNDGKMASSAPPIASHLSGPR